MALDLEAIRRRVAEMSGQRRNSSVQLWKPTEGEYVVRGIPWKDSPPGMPFHERQFYWIGDQRVLAPSQFGKPDPVNALLRKLYSTKLPEDRELAKKLQPKMTAYMALIVRGQEDKGVLVWAFNKFLYTRLLGFFGEADVGDFLDPLTGIDLKVNIVKSPKVFNGKPVFDTNVDLARKSSKLSNDEAQMKKWLDGTPNIDDMWQQKTSQEIDNMVTAWLAGGVAGDTTDPGTSRGPEQPKSALDELVADVKGAVAPKSVTDVKSVAPKLETVAPAKRNGKKTTDVVEAIENEQTSAKKTSLDEAFDALMNDDPAE